MKFNKIITFALLTIVTALSTSCGTLPEREKQVGPVSDLDLKPWNRRLPGEGQGALGGFSR